MREADSREVDGEEIVRAVSEAEGAWGRRESVNESYHPETNVLVGWHGTHY